METEGEGLLTRSPPVGVTYLTKENLFTNYIT